MNSFQFSSGDLVADRRADYAETLFAGGDHAAATELMADTLQIAPRWCEGWFRFGEMAEAAGNLEQAAAAWREALRLDPEDHLGAALKLQLIGALTGLDSQPIRFVESLFDQYAGKFDHALVEKLGYRVPQLLHAELLAHGDAFAHALDLGCGTGLMGERLRASTSFLEGCDLSEEMLRKAEAKKIYDRLRRADLQVMDLPVKPIDLITAADVFIYVGALDRLFGRIAAMLAPGGIFAFSVEKHDGPEDMVLRPSRRFAHSERHIRELLQQAEFVVSRLKTETIRFDRGEPVEGLIVVARRGGESAEQTIAPLAAEGEELRFH